MSYSTRSLASQSDNGTLNKPIHSVSTEVKTQPNHDDFVPSQSNGLAQVLRSESDNQIVRCPIDSIWYYY